MNTVSTIPPIWENPEIQSYNRLPMRSPLLPFPSAREALADAVAGPEFPAPEKNPYVLSLDGVWTFKLLDRPLADYRQEDPACGESDDAGFRVPVWARPSFTPQKNGGPADTTVNGNWADIRVPGTWTRQGYDKPHYTNVQMPFEALPPRAPEQNPTGLYRRTFTLPPGWAKRRTVLHLGSAESCFLIYINGIFAGAGKDTRLPSEYDISPFVREGENLIGIKVVRYSDASYVEDQDQWWYGGIHRSVFLYSSATSYIQDLRAYPGSYDDRQGKLSLEISLGGEQPESRSNAPSATGGEQPFTIDYALYPFALPESRSAAEDFAGKLVNGAPLAAGRLEFTPSYQHNANIAKADLVLPQPKLWSHEAPNLYVVQVSLSRNGSHIESTAFLTGFRSVRIANRELRINGALVYIKGANRHEHDEKTGKTLSTAAMKRDIVLLKTHNFNAVRTCHYPDDERWYDLCDRYGIYLVDEANVESHAFYHQLCREQGWSYAFAARIQRMVERDKNHPSIILWSLGNESGCGDNHAMMSAWIHSIDPTRPVNYEGAISGPSLDILNGAKEITDIVSPMYPQIERITDFVKYRQDHRPLIMIEYSHAMGNSNGSLADYWKAIETHHGLQGGFIWEWIDHGLEAFTPEGLKYWNYGGDFGDEPSDRDFIVDGLLLPDQGLKPGMAECRQVQAPLRLKGVDGKPWTFTVENRQNFSGMEDCGLEWKLLRDAPLGTRGGDRAGQGAETVLARGSVALPDIKPGESAEITLTPPEGFKLQALDGTVYLHFDFTLKNDRPWAQAGHVIGQAERILKETPQAVSILAPGVQGLSAEAAPLAGALAAAFRPSLFRVPTQNDGLKTALSKRGDPGMEFYYQGKAMFIWLDYDLLHLQTVDETTEAISWEGWAASRYTATLLAGKGALPEFRDATLGVYTAILVQGEPAGAAGRPYILDATFDLDPRLPELPKIGLSAPVSAAYDTISWFGAGPDESYPDRLAAAFLGRYRHRVADLETRYVVPQENGNRSLVRNLSLLNASPAPGKPRALSIWCDTPLNMSALRYTQENMLEALHTCDLVDTTTGPAGYFTLNLDLAQRGVGTATCGPDTRPEYRVRPGLYHMRLYIGGV
ncbi:MAG: DUF4981 domain-containing protein [Treponema sp.]|jgi:beta-galactosidase|nr:DUF4981 domain-containing protein [Treponema sp.]